MSSFAEHDRNLSALVPNKAADKHPNLSYVDKCLIESMLSD